MSKPPEHFPIDPRWDKLVFFTLLIVNLLQMLAVYSGITAVGPINLMLMVVLLMYLIPAYFAAYRVREIVLSETGLRYEPIGITIPLAALERSLGPRWPDITEKTGEVHRLRATGAPGLTWVPHNAVWFFGRTGLRTSHLDGPALYKSIRARLKARKA